MSIQHVLFLSFSLALKGLTLTATLTLIFYYI